MEWLVCVISSEMNEVFSFDQGIIMMIKNEVKELKTKINQIDQWQTTVYSFLDKSFKGFVCVAFYKNGSWCKNAEKIDF